MKKQVKVNWNEIKTVQFSIEKAAEGGLGSYALTILKDAGIPVRRCYSPYIGHIGIEVPAKFEKKAEKLVL